MAGAGAGPGGALVSAADEVEHILAGGVFAVLHAQRAAALAAEDEALEREVVGAAARAAAAGYELLHPPEALGVNERLVRALDDGPVLGRQAQALFGLVADPRRAALHHVADVGLVLQRGRDALGAPEAGIGPRLRHAQPGVGGGRGDALGVERGGYGAAAHAREGEAEDAPHDGRGLLVCDDAVLLRRVHPVAVHGLAADEEAAALLVALDGLYLLRNVLGVHVVHDGAEGRDVVGGGVYARVDAVQQGDVPHAVLGEVALHIVAGEDVVAAEPGEVLGYDQVDAPGLDVGEHAAESGAVEVRAAPAASM